MTKLVYLRCADLLESASRRLVPKDERIRADIKRRSQIVVNELLEEYGPVVSAYPFWHPMLGKYSTRYLVGKHPFTPRPRYMSDIPGRFDDKLISHAVFFRNAFISCPYEKPDAFIEFLNNYHSPFGHFVARRLNEVLYGRFTNPFIVEWHWDKQYGNNLTTIHNSVAAKLMMHSLIPVMIDGMYCSPTNEMIEALIGEPCCTRESVFIDRVGTRNLKGMWEQVKCSGALLPPIPSINELKVK